MKILVTGAAGFIGCETSLAFLKDGHEVVGIDNLNDYYTPQLKHDRLARIPKDHFRFVECSLADKETLLALFKENSFDIVVNLAAQAGVRYSLINPQSYVDSNITGFLNILECARAYPPKHLVYASSSSVYGRNTETPFRTTDRVEKPSSLYAATKRSNELMAETYHHLFQLNLTGLRFFTVYGPWGRPDMSPWLFANAITHDKPIKVFNNGKMMRDFTYIDDIVEGIRRIAYNGAEKSEPLNRLYNIGRGQPIKLMDFIATLEKNFGKVAEKIMMPMQPGDVEITWADTEALEKDIGYKPSIDLDTGIARFAEWFKSYNKD
ncbi:MAG: NAD-dependent epimerase/dehydratase family protein [Fibrobacter sp.]|nr:NAD-dependent epimerase/dehydratase family protein [Fibrobacter sp.]